MLRVFLKGSLQRDVLLGDHITQGTVIIRLAFLVRESSRTVRGAPDSIGEEVFRSMADSRPNGVLFLSPRLDLFRRFGNEHPSDWHRG